MAKAGRPGPNAVPGVRGAVDFLRCYAAEVRRDFDNASHVPLGPVVCISPWNFPLAIFTGQVGAALAAGNVVLAKPAEQTPLVAAAAVRALHAAGVPRGALQLLPGRGETVGAALVADARVQGVLFTGSTEVARLLQRTLSRRLTAGGQPVPLIAETGGPKALVGDSAALVGQAGGRSGGLGLDKARPRLRGPAGVGAVPPVARLLPQAAPGGEQGGRGEEHGEGLGQRGRGAGATAGRRPALRGGTVGGARCAEARLLRGHGEKPAAPGRVEWMKLRQP